MSPALAIAACLLAVSDPDLAVAEHAFEAAHYEDVLPALQRAREHPMTTADTRRALELEAITHAAFDDRFAAIEAFRKLLGLDPAYRPDPSYGPKVHGWWEHAKRLGARPAPEVTDPPPPPPPPPEPPAPKVETRRHTPPPFAPRIERPPPEEPAVYTRWYFWAGAGGAVVVVGAAVATGLAASHPGLPPGNLGTGGLR